MEVTDKFLAAIFAALIAGTMSLLIYVLDRSKDITKARKEWVDGLREEISLFLGSITTISLLWETKSPSECLKCFRIKHKELYQVANTAYHKALLHLNQPANNKERLEEGNLRNSLHDLYTKFVSKNSDCGTKTPELAKNVRENSRALFYREWEKVKVGEPVYRYVKAAAMGMVFGIIPPLILLWSIWINHPPEIVFVLIAYIVYLVIILVYLDADSVFRNAFSKKQIENKSKEPEGN